MVERSDATGSRRLPRRRVLQTIGGASIVGLAGCSGGGGSDGGTGDGGDGGDTGSTDESTPTETETETETSDESSGGQSGGTLQVAQVKSPADWDPVLQLGGPAAIIGERFYSNLYTYDEGTTVVPDDLATGMPETERDGARWIVEIVDDARFHNGDPVTAEDVAYTFRAPIEEETRMATTYSMVDSIEVIDETTVQFDLDYPYAAFAGSLAQMGIVPKSVRESDPQAFNTSSPVGSGPFRFVDWTENEYTYLERWDDYWGEKDPNLDRVEWTPIPEPTTRLTEFKSGGIHLMQGIPPKLYSTVTSMGDAEVHETPALSYRYLTFNLNEGQTTKPKVREAIDRTFSMDQFVEKFVAPAGVRQYQPIPIPTAEAWDMPIEEFESMAVGKDIDRAKSLFEEAGVPSGWTCTLLSPPDDVRENLCVTVANGIKEAGYDAEVQRLDWGTYLETFASGNKADYQMYALGWSVTPDPDYQMYSMYHSSGAGSNHGHYWSDESIMEKIEESRRTTDRERRRQLYIDIQKAVISQRVQIPGWNLKETWARKQSVQDFQVHPVPTENPRLVTGYNNVSIDG
jgi:peptide/nickel transport system substrate-binding protein